MVMNRIKIINNGDALLAEQGRLERGKVRSVEVEALVDTGAVSMVIPEDIAEELGLVYEGRRTVRYADGRTAEIPLVLGARYEICGRTTVCETYVTPRGTQVLIGQIPLEGLDLIVDPENREVRPNPAHPDFPIVALLQVA